MPIYGPCECCGREAYLAYVAHRGSETMACALCCGCEPDEFDPDDDDEGEGEGDNEARRV